MDPYSLQTNLSPRSSSHDVSNTKHKRSRLSRIKSVLSKKNRPYTVNPYLYNDPVYSEIDASHVSSITSSVVIPQKTPINVKDRRTSRKSNLLHESSVLLDQEKKEHPSDIKVNKTIYAQVNKGEMKLRMPKVERRNSNSPNRFLSEVPSRKPTPPLPSKSPAIVRTRKEARETRSVIDPTKKEEYINCEVLSRVRNKSPPFEVKTIYRYKSQNLDELSFDKNQLLIVLPWRNSQVPEEGWFYGKNLDSGKKGLFPQNYVEQTF